MRMTRVRSAWLFDTRLARIWMEPYRFSLCKRSPEMRMAKPSLLLSALALTASLSVQAHEPPTDGNPSSPTESGMVAGIDAKTGKLRKLTDTEIRALSDKANAMPSASRSAAGANAAWARIPQTGTEAAKTIRLQSNGMSTADLPLSAMNSLSIERTATGEVRILENGDPLSHGRQEVSE
ncbi:hypothetical protein [Stenotrophomonas sp.]|uniref:post-PEP-CTERM-1 domain-containing protein n=1 Tax=Stenotrophomonas sp. TaxID=69392 RepID=UPI0028A9E7A4|nr:hypothetical protein [Stenotrophomonas sp.]